MQYIILSINNFCDRCYVGLKLKNSREQYNLTDSRWDLCNLAQDSTNIVALHHMHPTALHPVAPHLASCVTWSLDTPHQWALRGIPQISFASCVTWSPDTPHQWALRGIPQISSPPLFTYQSQNHILPLSNPFAYPIQGQTKAFSLSRIQISEEIPVVQFPIQQWLHRNKHNVCFSNDPLSSSASESRFCPIHNLWNSGIQLYDLFSVILFYFISFQ